MQEIKIPIRLPKPHEKQGEFIWSSAKRKVIVAGRRGGKTAGVSMLAALRFLDGRRVLYAAPTQDQTDAFWEACKGYFGEAIQQGYVYKNETRRLLDLPSARIRAKTAWDADTMRGDYADLLILEEYALMDPSAWSEVGAPMLLDNNGDAVFIFTPKRRNHAFHTYQKAIADTTGRWATWHFSSLDNPHLSQEALDEIIADMSEDGYRQEILAEFLEGEGAVFRNVRPCLTAPGDEQPAAHVNHTVVAGVDWGKHQDFTAISVFCADCAKELAVDRFNQIDYAFQRERLKTLYDRWAISVIHAEANAMGEPIIEQLQRDGMQVSPFQTTGASKPPLIENLALAFEREEAQWIDNPVWTGELEAYERTVSKTTGRSAYSAPQGMHDDTVIARALAWHGASHRPAKVKVLTVESRI